MKLKFILLCLVISLSSIFVNAVDLQPADTGNQQVMEFEYYDPIFPILLPDLGLYGFVKIGENQRLVRWGNTITLTPADAYIISGGTPAFKIYYSEKNYGNASASGYENTIVYQSIVRSRQTNRSLTPNQKKDILTYAYIPISATTQALTFKIDAANNFFETSEANNIGTVYVNFSGFVPMPELCSYGQIKIGENLKTIPWGGTITLTPADAFFISSNGTPAFNIYYSEKNYGTADAIGYKNTITLDGILRSQQTNRSLTAGQKKDIHTQAYLPASAGTHKLYLNIDADNNISEENEYNNSRYVNIIFSGF